MADTPTRTYTFNVICKSGETKETVIVANTFAEARIKLAEFVNSN